MSDAVIRPGRLSGRVLVPPSKSAAHRAAICSALAGSGGVFPENEPISADIRATARAVRALRTYDGTAALPLDCAESGSTLRFLIPLAAALGISAVFTGSGRLPERPIGIYLSCLPAHGVSCATAGGLPLRIRGTLTPGVFSLPGNVSSQFITGLLLALPLLSGDSEIVLSAPLESAGYVDLTLQIMEEFGVTARRTGTGWHIPGNQRYRARKEAYRVERDWSQAAFFLAAGALGGTVSLEGLNPDSRQGDRAAERLFRAFGADIRWEGDTLSAAPGTLRGIEIDAAQIPDLVPALAVTAALCEGETRIVRAQRLRLKESDRLSALEQGLNRLGGRVQQTGDGLLISGVPALRGGKVEGQNDHRIVMAFAVAALRADGPVTISDAESVRKSYPSFFSDFKKLGGNADVVGLG